MRIRSEPAPRDARQCAPVSILLLILSSPWPYVGSR